MNIYGDQILEPQFSHIANLYAPATVDAMRSRTMGRARSQVSRMKRASWNTNGHRSRALGVNDATLADICGLLYDDDDTPPD